MYIQNIGKSIGMVIGAIMGGIAGGLGGSIIEPIGGTIIGSYEGAIAGSTLGAITGTFLGSEVANSLNLMFSESSGTPNQARTKRIRQQGPREINHIDRPDDQPNSQWHAHGKNGGAIYQDGTIRHRDPGFTKKTIKWLRDHGWNI